MRGPTLEDVRYWDYEDEREEIVTYVSACGLQRNSNKDKLSSYEVSKSPRVLLDTRNHMRKKYKRGLSRFDLPCNHWCSIRELCLDTTNHSASILARVDNCILCPGNKCVTVRDLVCWEIRLLASHRHTNQQQDKYTYLGC